MNNVIVIFGGGLHRKKNGEWRTTTFSEGDLFGADGSYVRVIAGNILYQTDVLNNIIITSGGKGQYKNVHDVPHISKVIKDELILLGIPENKIIEENKSNNTWQQLLAIKKIIKKNKINKLIIISNKYHIPRIKMMIKQDNELNKIFKKNIIKLKSAENILIKHNPEKWKFIIEKAYTSESIKSRIKLEKTGLKDIKSGVYKLK